MAFSTVSNAMCNVFKYLGYRPLTGNAHQIQAIQTTLGRRLTMIEQCCYRGYLDAARRIMNQSKANRIQFIIDTIQHITTFVNGLIGIRTQLDFDNQFNNLCSTIINLGSKHGVVTKGMPSITFGSVQKIVNMALKYVYNEIRLGNPVVSPAVYAHIVYTACDFFHMPIDSIVLCIMHHVPVIPPFHTRIFLNISGTWTYNGSPWSLMNQSDYRQFLTDLRGSLMPNIKPLEAEYHTWGNPNPPSLKGGIYR